MLLDNYEHSDSMLFLTGPSGQPGFPGPSVRSLAVSIDLVYVLHLT